MAGTKIRGITIEIGGDTSGLNKALNDSNKEIRTTQSQLRDVEKLLKLDPANTELLAQKQELLGKKVKDVSSKLETLRKTEQQLREAGVDENSAQFEALRREIIATSEELEEAKKNAREFNAGLEQTKAKLGEISEKSGDFADATQGISRAAQVGLAGITALGAEAVKSYAEFEQLAGGVETLFGDAADIVQENAEKAFKTAGISANEYMETVTSFSASLLQSLGGDTKKAAEISDMALIDMSDNANKMGTSMESIQNAYQGFAKQNYTMLDNLKLGYGGTKEEMERLLADAEKLSGVHYDISNLSDVYNAIHEIQVEMGIAGTTSIEAEHTISGSINMLKASLNNLMTTFAQSNGDVSEAIDNVVNSVKTVASNIAPILKNLWDNLPVLAQIGVILLSITAVISPMARLISNVTSAVSNLIMILPKLMPILSTLTATAPWILLATAIAVIVVEIIKHWDEIKEAAKKTWEWIDSKMITPMVEGFNKFKDKIKDIWNSIVDFIKERINKMIDFVNGFINVINNLTQKLNNSGLGKALNININQIGTIPALANGGVLTSGSAIVGERGAELLTVSSGKAKVEPLTNTSSTVVNYNFNVDNIATYNQIERKLENQRLTQRMGYVGG